MKTLLFAAFIASLVATANADLIFVQEFNMIADRSTLTVSFKDDRDHEDKITVEASFGAGMTQMKLTARIPSILEPGEFQTAMGRFIRHLNDSRNTKISLFGAMKQSGWKL